MKNLVKHLPHYLSLVGMLLASLLAFFLFPYDDLFLLGVALATACGYITWGIVHHLIHKDLYLVTIIEYITVSILGLVIALSLIFK